MGLAFCKLDLQVDHFGSTWHSDSDSDTRAVT